MVENGGKISEFNTRRLAKISNLTKTDFFQLLTKANIFNADK